MARFEGLKTSIPTPHVPAAGRARRRRSARCRRTWPARKRRRLTAAAAAPAAGATPVMTAAPRRRRPATSPGARGERALRVRLHGRRVQVAGLRIRLREPRLELPRPARIDHQLRRQHEARVPHLLPRGISVAMAHGYFKAEGKPLAVMAHGTVGLQHAAMAHLQRVVRPRAGLHDSRQPQRCRHPAAPPSGTTACRTPRPWCATTPSGTTRRGR